VKLKWRVFKRATTLSIFFMLMYVLIMLLISTVVVDNPQLIFRDQVSAQILDPFDPGRKDEQGDSERFKQFEAFVMIASSTEDTGSRLHLMAFPGRAARLYRNFTIHIFSNMPCYYEVKIDGQLYGRGSLEWRTQIKTSSPYNSLEVEVRLVNETNATVPVFYFTDISLIESPWDAREPEDRIPIVEDWIQMTRGEFTMWVIRNILMQIGFGFLGAVAGISMATIQADLRGVERVI
jgi:hypothetical protein